MESPYDIYCGLDVGKFSHYAVAIGVDGEKLADGEFPQDEVKLCELFTRLADQGRVLVVVDQPNTIGALPVAVAQNLGVDVAYLPGLAMRRAADLYPGNAKTDARDAFIIADTARSMPHTLRAIDKESEVLAALKVLAGFDEDLTHECTRTINRLRNLLLGVSPALERVFSGTRLTQSLVLELFIKYHGPIGLREAGKAKVMRFARSKSTRDPSRLIDEIFEALSQQSVSVSGTAAVELVIPTLALNIKTLKAQRVEVAEQVENLLANYPLLEVLMSIPGVGIKTAATILLCVGDGSSFPTAAHLASYAGIAPVTRRSGSSIKGESPSRGGNKQLKNALFRSAWVASTCDPESKTYYARKRAQGKKHNAAIICLARRRCDMIYAMLRNGTFYRPKVALST